MFQISFCYRFNGVSTNNNEKESAAAWKIFVHGPFNKSEFLKGWPNSMHHPMLLLQRLFNSTISFKKSQLKVSSLSLILRTAHHPNTLSSFSFKVDFNVALFSLMDLLLQLPFSICNYCNRSLIANYLSWLRTCIYFLRIALGIFSNKASRQFFAIDVLKMEFCALKNQNRSVAKCSFYSSKSRILK